MVKSLNNAQNVNFTCHIASTIEHALLFLSTIHFDVIITDLDLPNSNNIDTIDTLLSKEYRIPIILLSNTNNEQTTIDSKYINVENFIPKQYINDKNLITRTIQYTVERYKIKAGIEATRERERYLAQYDQITKLPNRSLFLDRISQTIMQSCRDREQFALCFLDLDRFKSINDTFGHDVGDKVLCAVGSRLQKSIRTSDTVARLGGDEFTFILRKMPKGLDLTHIAEHIIKEINIPIQVQHQTCSVGASIGIACYPQHGETKEKLLKNADIAMYDAKHKGRNQYCFFSQSLSEQNRKAFELEVALKEALQNPSTQFSMHYQPKINLTTGVISSFEGLIRWNHPTLGNISPNRFIPLAEEVCLIDKIDEWVLRTVCQQLEQWQTQKLQLLPIGVNVSNCSFNKPRFVEDTIIPILKEYKIAGHWLEIEITEGILLSDIKQVQQRLATLKKLGLGIAIDDFGTGFSSLSYLNNFPIDTLKIDNSFICDMTNSRKEQAVLNAIISLGHALEVNVVAEGVETHAQRKLLAHLNCHEGQGFLWGHPSPQYMTIH